MTLNGSKIWLRKVASKAQQGEAAVATWLEQKGWQILGRNVRHIGFELDLVVTKGSSLVAVEVKWRKSISSEAFWLQNLLPAKKLRCLQRGLMYFMSKHHLSNVQMLRIDLAIIYPEKRKDYGWKIDYKVGIG